MELCVIYIYIYMYLCDSESMRATKKTLTTKSCCFHNSFSYPCPR